MLVTTLLTIKRLHTYNVNYCFTVAGAGSGCFAYRSKNSITRSK